MYNIGYFNGTEYYYVPGGGQKKKSPGLSKDERKKLSQDARNFIQKMIEKTEKKIEKYRAKINLLEKKLNQELDDDLKYSKLYNNFLKTGIDISKRQPRRELADRVKSKETDELENNEKYKKEYVPRAELNKYLELLVDLEIEKYNYKIAQFDYNFNKNFDKQKIKALEKILTRGIERKKRRVKKLLKDFLDEKQLDKLIKN